MKIEIISVHPKDMTTPEDWRFEKRPLYISSGGPSETFEQVGEDDVLVIRVRKLLSWQTEFIAAAHALIEAALCKHLGVTREDVARFDADFEAHRHPDNQDQSGDSPSAPHAPAHCVATGIERLLAAEFGILWKAYQAERDQY